MGNQIVVRKTGLIKLDAATTQLAKATSIKEVKEIRDKAEAIRKYAAVSGAGLDLQNAGAELKLRAERKAGLMLKGMERQKRGGDQKSKLHNVTSIPTLEDINITKIQSSRWQKEASIPKERFEEHIKETKEAEKELTTTGIIRLASNLLKKEEVETTPLPKGKYNIIYADPPWDYGGPEQHGKFETVQDKTLKSYYPPMSLKKICELPIPNLTAKEAVLFLWVTSPFLKKSFEVIEAWDFEYKTSFVWNKIKHNVGHYNSVRHEFLLIATKGSYKPDHKKLYNSVQSIERTKHSRKPEKFRQIIDDIYRKGKRIELFRRGKKIKNWDVWGHETK